MTHSNDSAWFAPKRFGLGSGLPIAWQGWALLAAHVALIFAGLPLAEHSHAAFAAYAIVVGCTPLPLYAAKTRGGWKWRWGERD